MRPRRRTSLFVGMTVAGTLSLLAGACGSFAGSNEPGDASAGDPADAASEGSQDGTTAAMDGPWATDGACGAWAPIYEGFEAAESPPPGWTETTSGTSISLMRDTATKYAGAASLHVGNNGVEGSHTFRRPLVVGTDGPPCALHLSLAVRRGTDWQTSQSGATFLALSSATARLQVAINKEGQLELAEQSTDGGDYRSLAYAPLSGDAWHTLAIVWNLSAGSASLEVNGAPATKAGDPALLVGQVPSTVDLGAMWMEQNAKGLWLDDLTIE